MTLPGNTAGLADAGRALQAAGIGIWHWDIGAGQVELSPQAASLLDCRASQPIGYQDFLALAQPEDRARLDSALRNSAAATALAVDFRPLASNRWLSARGQVFAHHGGPNSASGVLIDVSSAKHSESRNDQFAAIFLTSEAAIVGKTLDGIITDWNAGAEAIFGYSAAEMVGTTIARLMPEGQADESLQILERVRRGEQVQHFETRRRRKDGEIIDVSLSVAAVRDREGRLLGASKVARDITAAKRAKAALLEDGDTGRVRLALGLAQSRAGDFSGARLSATERRAAAGHDPDIEQALDQLRAGALDRIDPTIEARATALPETKLNRPFRFTNLH